MAFFLAINDDTPAARDQVQRQVLGKGLEAAVRGRHAARAQDAQRARCGVRAHRDAA